MKKYKAMAGTLCLATIMWWLQPVCIADAQTAHDATVESVVLFPGDSRSIEFEYNDTLGSPDSYHVALIAAMAPDQEIDQLTINLSPRGDVGPEIGYFTWGIFFSFTGCVFDFVEMLDPKFTYGFNSVNYLVDVNPYMSLRSALFRRFSRIFSF